VVVAVGVALGFGCGLDIQQKGNGHWQLRQPRGLIRWQARLQGKLDSKTGWMEMSKSYFNMSSHFLSLLTLPKASG
jgi:hypothetical protein